MSNSHLGLVTFKNMDRFHVWPAKHRHWTFEIAENEAHEIWVNTKDLRDFYDKLPSDRELKDIYHRSMLYAKDVKAHFIGARAMRQALIKSKAYSQHTDVLRFLDWFDRNVAEVAAKKKSNSRQDKANLDRERGERTVMNGPIPLDLAHPQMDDSTLPPPLQERWALEQVSTETRRVFHPEARPLRTTWKQWAQTHTTDLLGYLTSFWRGERNLFLTVGLSWLLLLLARLVFNLLVPESLDWTVSYRRVLWACAFLVPMGWAWVVWFLVSMTRSTRRAWMQPGGKLWATAVYLAVFPMAPLVATASYERELLEYLWAMVAGNEQPVSVYADPYLGRVVIKGPLNYGSAEELLRILDTNPKFTLIQIESPGGFVIEGMRIAKLVADRKMDTVSLERCGSACTLILASGADRYLGPDVRVGFHRSGLLYGPVEIGWSETDQEIAKYFRARGVSEGFVDKALTPSVRQIWTPSHPEMYAAGYANLKWSERKPGY